MNPRRLLARVSRGDVASVDFGDGGQAKPYQVRQAIRLVERYNLKLEGES